MNKVFNLLEGRIIYLLLHRKKIVQFVVDTRELVGMSHQLVALLGGCIERDWVIDLVIGRVWHLLVRAIDAT